MKFGMDCSIRDIAIVREDGQVIVSEQTGLSLSSSVNDLIDYGRALGQALKFKDHDVLYVDAVHSMFVGRYKQFSYNSILIAAICATCGAYIEYVSPAQVRKRVGLKGKTSKQDVWDAYAKANNVSFNYLPTEHTKDAFCLALY